MSEPAEQPDEVDGDDELAQGLAGLAALARKLAEEARAEAGQTTDTAAVYADLAGVPEIAEALKVNIYRVRRWIERRESTGCPNPVRKLACGHVYSLADWRGWFALWRVTRGSETWNRKNKGGTSGE